MGALVKMAVGGAASQLKANPASFVVKLGRFLYSSTVIVIGTAWYSSWRNERVQQGDYSNWPLPGVNKLPKRFSADRPNPAGPKAVLAADFPTGGGNIPGVVVTASNAPGKALLFDGKPVAAWIVPILKYARAHGWRGNVNNGYRTTGQQAAIYNSGVRPAAKPGTSNHEKLEYPGGAVDVTNAAQLSAILLASPYKNVLIWAGAKDPVHFSHPHDGGY